MGEEFEYGGYHFTPHRNFTKREGGFFKITRRVRSDRTLGICTYDWRKVDYDYEAFYVAAGGKNCDLFLCVENGYLYVPCLNELFLYPEKTHNKQCRRYRA